MLRVPLLLQLWNTQPRPGSELVRQAVAGGHARRAHRRNGSSLILLLFPLNLGVGHNLLLQMARHPAVAEELHGKDPAPLC